MQSDVLKILEESYLDEFSFTYIDHVHNNDIKIKRSSDKNFMLITTCCDDVIDFNYNFY